MVAVNRQSKMLAFINARVRVTIVDGRHIVGRFLAFDRHMNLVLADAEEFRRLKKKKTSDTNDDNESLNNGEDVRRVLGFVLLRGEEVVSLAVEGPPVRVKKIKPLQAAADGGGGGIPLGAGVARPAGRGAPMPGMMMPSSGAAAAVGQPLAGGPPPGMMMPPPGFRPGMGPPPTQ